MSVMSKTARTGAAAVLLCAGITAGAHGFVPGGGGNSVGGTARSYVRITGTVMCAPCSLEEAQEAQPQKFHLYELTHKRGRVVMEVTQLNHPQQMIDLAYPPRLQVRAADSVFARLTAEENLRKEIEITGILRSTRTLDIFDVTIRG